MSEDILNTINDVVRGEKGKRVTLESSLRDAELDSFGITMLLLELDAKYDYFKYVPEDTDPFSTVDYDTITIKDMVAKCM